MYVIMKQMTLLFLSFLFVIVGFAQTAPAIEWQNTIGGAFEDMLTVALQTADGGYILGGSSRSDISGDKSEDSQGSFDYWIVKTDAQGNIQWQQTIGGEEGDTLQALQQTSDGGYLLGGYSRSNISGDKTENSQGLSDYWIVKTDASGNIQWQQTIGGEANDRLRSIQQTADGGFILAGNSYSNISGDKTENCQGDYDYWIVKTDAQGDIQWQNTIGGSGIETAYHILPTSDGGFILAGSSHSNQSGDKTENSQGLSDYWIVKIDAQGTIQWQNTIGGSGTDSAFYIQQTSDGGYIIGGSSDSGISGDKTENSHGGIDYWIVKTDASGNIQWENTIGGSDYEFNFSLQQLSDGGYILGGYSNSNISGDKTEDTQGFTDFWIIKTDAMGNILWQNSIGGNANERGGYVWQTADGGFILGGTSRSDISGDKTEDSQGGDDYWILKLESDNSTSALSLSDDGLAISVAPNPASTSLYVTSQWSLISRLEIQNALGEKVADVIVDADIAAKSIDISRLSAGVYFLVVRTNKGTRVLPFLKV